MINDSHEVVVDRATLKDDDVYAGNPHAILEIMQEDMMNNEDHDSIPKDIFDESLRYSGVDRPSLSISKSSPLNQRRGSFEDHGEKIANLFKMWFAFAFKKITRLKKDAHYDILQDNKSTWKCESCRGYVSEMQTFR